MTRFRIAGAVLLGLSLVRPAFLGAAPAMTQDQLEAYFQSLKKGAPIQLSLDKGKDVKGTFASYDDYYETVWIVPRAEERGLLSQKGYKLAGIRGVEAWDPKSSSGTDVSPSSNTDGFILMRKDAHADE